MTADDLATRIAAALDGELAAAVELRHRLHADPYPSGAEGPTLKIVVEALGWDEVRPVADTGALVAPGPGSIVLRAELDGLPVVEQNDVAWRSSGSTMHACGHDVHLAAAVAAARAIRACSPPVPAAVLFQPREELPPSGAAEVVASGMLSATQVRAVVAAHVQPQLPPGVVNVTAGVVNASVDEFEIVVHGHGGHAGYPHTVRDPILGASAVVLALQQLVSRRVDPVRGAVCTVGRIAGGTAGNVVPDDVTLVGTLRAMDTRDRDALLADLRTVVTGTATGYGCSAEVTVRSGEPAVDNDTPLAEAAARRLAADGIPTDTTWRSFGSDDFSHFNAVLPSLMAFVGVDGGAGLHEPRFLPPDDTVALVARTLVAEYLAAVDVLVR